MKKQEKQYAGTSWVVQDVLDYAEQYDYKITKKQAERLLKENEERIAESMIATGWEVISSALNTIKSAS